MEPSPSLFVTEFHTAFNLPVRSMPTAIPFDEAELRKRLLEEEFKEYIVAADADDIVGVADGLADMAYVIFGSALAYGIDLDAIIAEVHRSNMSKLDAEGRPVMRVDGKVLKSDRYTPPDIAGVLGFVGSSS